MYRLSTLVVYNPQEFCLWASQRLPAETSPQRDSQRRAYPSSPALMTRCSSAPSGLLRGGVNLISLMLPYLLLGLPQSGEWEEMLFALKHQYEMTRVEGKMRPCMPSRPVVSNSFAMPWIAARQPPLSMGFSRQEYWNGLRRPPPRDLPNPGNKPTSIYSVSCIEDGFFTTEPTWEDVPLCRHSLNLLFQSCFPCSQSPKLLCLIFKALHVWSHGINLGNPKRRTRLQEHLEKVQDVCVYVGGWISKMPKVVLQGGELYQGARVRVRRCKQPAHILAQEPRAQSWKHWR